MNEYMDCDKGKRREVPNLSVTKITSIDDSVTFPIGMKTCRDYSAKDS